MTRSEHRANRTAQIARLDDADVLCLALVYRSLGLLLPDPAYVDPDALRRAIVEAECARMAPELRVIHGQRKDVA